MREQKSEQQHYHSRDGYDNISSSSLSYIQFRNKKSNNNNNNILTRSKSKQSLFRCIHIRSYIIILLFLLLLLIIYSTLFPIRNHTDVHISHRLKRQILASNVSANNPKHNIDSLQRILRMKNSPELVDCTINIPRTDIYSLPLENSVSLEVIHLVENYFQNDIINVKETVRKIRQKLSQSPHLSGDYAMDEFQSEFNLTLRSLLATHLSIKEMFIMMEKDSSNENNGDLYIYYDTIKYFRDNHYDNTKSKPKLSGYESVYTITVRRETNSILQQFTTSRARETLIQNVVHNNTLMENGWWIGPVLCEKNKNETFIMAHIFPLKNNLFAVTYFNISSVDINQCANASIPFGNTHLCPEKMKCNHQPGQGFRLGAYECSCLEQYEKKNIRINSTDLEQKLTGDESSSSTKLKSCECNPESCQIVYNHFLHTIIRIIQSIFIVFVTILATIVFKRRKTKIIKHSMWILLELILLGAVLLYASVIADSFSPHGFVCLIMPWLRELGFTIVYGTLILRIYKMLAEFQSRKAHCVQVKEKDILRILFFINISIIGYLLGWTLVNIDHSNEHTSLGKYLLGPGSLVKENSYFQTCRPRSWDYLVQFAEFIFLCVGIRFIYSTRTAPCEYHERKLITIAIVCEMIFSTLLHIIKDCLWSSVHPDVLFILSVIRCHFTVTLMLILIFCTKLCYIFQPFNDEHSARDRFRSVADGIDPSDIVTKLHSNGDIEFGELNIRDMDPEEIRTELKRLYTSLHVLKTKTMRKDNPHLTKRHGQRRKNRRFSMQAFQRHGGTSVQSNTPGGPTSVVLATGEKHEHEATKTPEDSTGSHTEHTHLGGIGLHRVSIDEIDNAHGKAASDSTSAIPVPTVVQRVTFK